MANNTGTFFNINDNDGIPLVGVSTDGKVMINHLYGNCLIGSTSVTGTAAQPLQVTGGAYVSGNLGIGTTNPTTKLSVVGDGNFTGVVTATSFTGSLTGTASTANNVSSTININTSGIITASSFTGSLVGIASTATNALGLSATASINTSGIITASSFVGGLTGTASTATTALGLSTTASINTSGIITATGGFSIGIQSGGTNIATGVITAINFVGSGNTFSYNSTTKVVDVTIFSGGSSVSISTNTTNQTQYIPYVTSFGSTTGFGATTLLVYNPSSGNLGIGTTNPTSKLHVVPTDTSIAGLFSGTTSNDMVRITQTGTGNALVVEDETNPNSSPFVVKADGSVGIGTTNPTSKLEVEPTSGQIGAWFSGNTIEDMFRITQSGIGNALVIESVDNDSSPFVVRADGSVGIGTVNPTTKLDVRGDLRVNDGSLTVGPGVGLSVYAAYSRQLSPQVGTAITSKAVNATAVRKTDAAIYDYIWDNYSVYDADGDGVVSYNDSLLIIRYLFGKSDSDLLDGINFPSNATRTTATSIRNHLGLHTMGGTGKLDVDGSGVILALGDGLMISRVFTGGFTNPADDAPAKLITDAYFNVNSYGLVGIGTVNPTTKLDVVGDLRVVPTSTSIAGLFSGTTSNDMVRITQFGSGAALRIEDETSPDSTPFVITATGSVGIGTTNPTTRISIAGTTGISFGDTNIRLGDVSTGSSITSGLSNFFGGNNAGQFTTTGSYNNFLGNGAGFNNGSGSNNIFLGQEAGFTNQTGSQNIVIGYNQNTPILNGSNQLVIGAGNTAWITGNSSYNVGFGTTNPTAKVHIGAATTSAAGGAPLKIGAGTTILTTPEVGAIEYDGSYLYQTPNSTSGRAYVPPVYSFRLTANGANIGATIADFFATPSSLSLEASSVYKITCFAYFTKTTAGTATWTHTFSSAPTIFTSSLTYSPVTGIANGTQTNVLSYSGGQATASMAHAATASLTTGVNHFSRFELIAVTSAATNWRLRLTQSAGTATPLAGSFYTIEKVGPSTGTFVA
jgi:hypothetical protein